MFNVANTNVIVTGATKGIGKGIATVFAKAGARVLVVGRNEQDGKSVVNQIHNDGGQAAFLQADISLKEECTKMVEFMVQQYGGVDVIVANAGVFPQAKLDEIDEKHIDSMMNTNLKGAIYSIQACAPFLRKSSHGGRVILISSITGPITGMPSFSVYGASKAAMSGFMKSLAVEVAQENITVNAVLPGNIRTEALINLGPEYEKNMSASIPMKRLGSVEDIGHAVLFLATKEASFITGQTIVVDGGQTIPESLI